MVSQPVTSSGRNHWIYFVNDRNENWGYFRPDGSRVLVLDFFLGEYRDLSAAKHHNWTLSRKRRDFVEDDVIWVRAAQPLGAFIGCGVVAGDLTAAKSGDGFEFPVIWDDVLCRRMATDPVGGVLEKHTQGVRKLSPSELSALLDAVDQLVPGSGTGDPPTHAVVKRLQEVTARQGQAVFRSRLRAAYRGRCAVTGTDVDQVLQAAHIWSYSVSGDNALRNGLLLRADIHDLFDRGLLWITAGLTIGIDAELKSSEYGGLSGKRLRLPKDPQQHPDPERLRQHRVRLAGRSK